MRLEKIKISFNPIYIYKFKGENLSYNESAVLEYCLVKAKTQAQIARMLSVNPSSVSVLIKKLESFNLIKVTRLGKGRMNLIKTKENLI